MPAALFQKVILPSAVQHELHDNDAPAVRAWIADPPAWVEVNQTPDHSLDDKLLRELDQGEQAAIALAIAIKADLVLMDDREGVAAARTKASR